MTEAEFGALFEQALIEDDEEENSQAWKAIAALHADASRAVFERAATWCNSDFALKRARGAIILGQLRQTPETEAEMTSPVWLFRGEALNIISELIEKEADPAVLHAAISSLGHLDQPDAALLISKYLDYPDEDVRFAVACALGCFPNEPTSVNGLLQLAQDADSDVRDWAVFGLGVQGSQDSEEIRELLLSCLHDEDTDVREEAAVGLAIRQDERVLPFLIQALGKNAVGERITEAAAWLLGFGYDPPKWDVSRFKAGLEAKFPAATVEQSD